MLDGGMSDTVDPRLILPASISPEARAMLELLGNAYAAIPRAAVPVTQQDFDTAAARAAEMGARFFGSAVERLAPRVEETVQGGVPVLHIAAGDTRDGAAPLVYVHGGGFVQGSARSSLLGAASAAASSGRVVYSIDYTLAPRAKWRTILDQIVSAWTDIVAVTGEAPGLFGDSAGGCIAAAATLLIRDRGLPIPRALALLSPVSDLAQAGDTNRSLTAVDFLDPAGLRAGLLAYADEADFADPLASPVHGDFAPGFPPTLIQVGTRELLLSDSVRLHRAIRAARRSSRLEVYEGMPHVFQPLLGQTPESRAAYAEMAEFWDAHL